MHAGAGAEQARIAADATASAAKVGNEAQLCSADALHSAAELVKDVTGAIIDAVTGEQSSETEELPTGLIYDLDSMEADAAATAAAATAGAAAKATVIEGARAAGEAAATAAASATGAAAPAKAAQAQTAVAGMAATEKQTQTSNAEQERARILEQAQAAAQDTRAKGEAEAAALRQKGDSDANQARSEASQRGASARDAKMAEASQLDAEAAKTQTAGLQSAAQALYQQAVSAGEQQASAVIQQAEAAATAAIAAANQAADALLAEAEAEAQHVMETAAAANEAVEAQKTEQEGSLLDDLTGAVTDVATQLTSKLDELRQTAAVELSALEATTAAETVAIEALTETQRSELRTVFEAEMAGATHGIRKGITQGIKAGASKGTEAAAAATSTVADATSEAVATIEGQATEASGEITSNEDRIIAHIDESEATKAAAKATYQAETATETALPLGLIDTRELDDLRPIDGGASDSGMPAMDGLLSKLGADKADALRAGYETSSDESVDATLQYEAMIAGPLGPIDGQASEPGIKTEFEDMIAGPLVPLQGQDSDAGTKTEFEDQPVVGPMQDQDTDTTPPPEATISDEKASEGADEVLETLENRKLFGFGSGGGLDDDAPPEPQQLVDALSSIPAKDRAAVIEKLPEEMRQIAKDGIEADKKADEAREAKITGAAAAAEKAVEDPKAMKAALNALPYGEKAREKMLDQLSPEARTAMDEAIEKQKKDLEKRAEILKQAAEDGTQGNQAARKALLGLSRREIDELEELYEYKDGDGKTHSLGSDLTKDLDSKDEDEKADKDFYRAALEGDTEEARKLSIGLAVRDIKAEVTAIGNTKEVKVEEILRMHAQDGSMPELIEAYEAETGKSLEQACVSGGATGSGLNAAEVKEAMAYQRGDMDTANVAIFEGDDGERKIAAYEEIKEVPGGLAKLTENVVDQTGAKPAELIKGDVSEEEMAGMQGDLDSAEAEAKKKLDDTLEAERAKFQATAKPGEYDAKKAEMFKKAAVLNASLLSKGVGNDFETTDLLIGLKPADAAILKKEFKDAGYGDLDALVDSRLGGLDRKAAKAALTGDKTKAALALVQQAADGLGTNTEAWQKAMESMDAKDLAKFEAECKHQGIDYKKLNRSENSGADRDMMDAQAITDPDLRAASVAAVKVERAAYGGKFEALQQAMSDTVGDATGRSDADRIKAKQERREHDLLSIASNWGTNDAAMLDAEEKLTNPRQRELMDQQLRASTGQGVFEIHDQETSDGKLFGYDLDEAGIHIGSTKKALDLYAMGDMEGGTAMRMIAAGEGILDDDENGMSSPLEGKDAATRKRLEARMDEELAATNRGGLDKWRRTQLDGDEYNVSSDRSQFGKVSDVHAMMQAADTTLGFGKDVNKMKELCADKSPQGMEDFAAAFKAAGHGDLKEFMLSKATSVGDKRDFAILLEGNYAAMPPKELQEMAAEHPEKLIQRVKDLHLAAKGGVGDADDLDLGNDLGNAATDLYSDQGKILEQRLKSVQAMEKKLANGGTLSADEQATLIRDMKCMAGDQSAFTDNKNKVVNSGAEAIGTVVEVGVTMATGFDQAGTVLGALAKIATKVNCNGARTGTDEIAKDVGVMVVELVVGKAMDADVVKAALKNPLVRETAEGALESGLTSGIDFKAMRDMGQWATAFGTGFAQGGLSSAASKITSGITGDLFGSGRNMEGEAIFATKNAARLNGAVGGVAKAVTDSALNYDPSKSGMDQATSFLQKLLKESAKGSAKSGQAHDKHSATVKAENAAAAKPADSPPADADAGVQGDQPAPTPAPVRASQLSDDEAAHRDRIDSKAAEIRARNPELTDNQVDRKARDAALADINDRPRLAEVDLALAKRVDLHADDLRSLPGGDKLSDDDLHHLAEVRALDERNREYNMGRLDGAKSPAKQQLDDKLRRLTDNQDGPSGMRTKRLAEAEKALAAWNETPDDLKQAMRDATTAADARAIMERQKALDLPAGEGLPKSLVDRAKQQQRLETDMGERAEAMAKDPKATELAKDFRGALGMDGDSKKVPTADDFAALQKRATAAGLDMTKMDPGKKLLYMGFSPSEIAEHFTQSDLDADAGAQARSSTAHINADGTLRRPMTQAEMQRSLAINVALYQTRDSDVRKMIAPGNALKMLTGEWTPTMGGDHADPSLSSGPGRQLPAASAVRRWAWTGMNSWAIPPTGKQWKPTVLARRRLLHRQRRRRRPGRAERGAAGPPDARLCARRGRAARSREPASQRGGRAAAVRARHAAQGSHHGRAGALRDARRGGQAQRGAGRFRALRHVPLHRGAPSRRRCRYQDRPGLLGREPQGHPGDAGTGAHWLGAATARGQPPDAAHAGWS